MYENYNKFITATDTIRKMQTDFSSIERQMDRLANSMQEISALSDRLGASLSNKRDNVHRLAAANSTLKQLQFLFDLPQTLQWHLNKRDYEACAKVYARMRTALQSYGTAPALQPIRTECDTIVAQLREQLRAQLSGTVDARDMASSSEAADAINLTEDSVTTINATAIRSAVRCLLLLGEDVDELRQQYMLCMRNSIDRYVEALRAHTVCKQSATADIDSNEVPVDVLEYVDTHVSSLLGNLSLHANAYEELFGGKSDDVNDYVKGVIEALITICEERFVLDIDVHDSALLVRAIDRFYRRLAATAHVLPCNVEYASAASAMALRIARAHISASLKYLAVHTHSAIKLARTQLAQSRLDDASNRNYLVTSVLTPLDESIVHAIKSALVALLQYVTCDCTLAQQENAAFVRPLSVYVRDELLVAYIYKLGDVFDEYCAGGGDKSFVNATLLLLLSKLAHNFETQTVQRLLDLCEQQFSVHRDSGRSVAIGERESAQALCTHMGERAQRLLDRSKKQFSFIKSYLFSSGTYNWNHQHYRSCLSKVSTRATG